MDGVVTGRSRKRSTKVSKKGRAYTRLQPKSARNPRDYRKAMKKTYKATKGGKQVIPVLSKCAHDYLKSQYDPWNVPHAPCVPDLIQIPSYKFSTRMRGTVHCNSSGFGCIVLNPYLPNKDKVTGPITNQDYLAPVWFTDGTHTGSVIRTSQCIGFSTSPVAGYEPAYWNSPITGNAVESLLDNIEGDVIWRPVGGGIKLQYNGALDSRSGNYTLFEDPSNSGWLGVRTPTINQLLGFEEVTQTIVDDSQVAVTFRPKNSMDLEYSDNWYMSKPIGIGQTNSGELAQYQTMGIVISGAQPSGAVNATFNFDCIMHWEGIGVSFSGRTVSHSDVSGMGKIQNVNDIHTSKLTPEQNLKNKEKSIVDMYRSVRGGLKVAGNYVFPGGEANTLIDVLDSVSDIHQMLQ